MKYPKNVVVAITLWYTTPALTFLIHTTNADHLPVKNTQTQTNTFNQLVYGIGKT